MDFSTATNLLLIKDMKEMDCTMKMTTISILML